MERNRTSQIIVETILVVSFCGITLLLSGCSELAALEENQLKIQQMIEIDSQRTAGDIASIERNQLTLRTKIENNSQSLARDISSMEQNQQQLEKLMQQSRRQIAQVDSGIKSSSESLAGNIATVQQNQVELRGGIQSSAKALISNIEALDRTQRNLQGGIEANSQAMVANISVIEKNQVDMRSSIELQLARMIKSIDVLGQNQDRLSQAVAQNSHQLSESGKTAVSLEKSLASLNQMIADVQNNTRNVNAKVVVVNDNQLKLQQGLDDKISDIMINVEKIESSLSRLHDMVAVVQSNTEQVNTKVALLGNTQKQLSRDVESRIQQVVKNIESLERLNSRVVTEPKVQQNSDSEEAKSSASE